MRQYIQEVVAPHIPGSGMFTLKNGVQIPAKQYIEEVVLAQIEDYNGDITALLENTTIEDDERDTEDTEPEGHVKRQERGMPQAQVEKLKNEQEAQRRRTEQEAKARTEREATIKEHNEQASKKTSIKIGSIDKKIEQTQLITSEVQTKNRQMGDLYKYKASYMRKLYGATLTPEQMIQAQQYEQMLAEREEARKQKKAQQNNQSKGLFMGR